MPFSALTDGGGRAGIWNEHFGQDVLRHERRAPWSPWSRRVRLVHHSPQQWLFSITRYVLFIMTRSTYAISPRMMAGRIKGDSARSASRATGSRANRHLSPAVSAGENNRPTRVSEFPAQSDPVSSRMDPTIRPSLMREFALGCAMIVDARRPGSLWRSRRPVWRVCACLMRCIADTRRPLVLDDEVVARYKAHRWIRPATYRPLDRTINQLSASFVSQRSVQQRQRIPRTR